MLELTPETRTAVESYWAGFLGVPDSTWNEAGVRIVPHSAELHDYRGIYALVTPPAAVISVPLSLMSSTEVLAAVDGPEKLCDPEHWCRALAAPGTSVIGPAFLGYTDASHFRAVGGEARLLGDTDAAAARALQEACDPIEWEHGGCDVTAHPAAGVYRGSTLVALAGYEVWGGTIAHLSVVTHPAHRGQGLAGQAVARMAEYALASGLIPQYRTLEVNRPSMAVGHTLGFRCFGHSMAVRLPL